jgi:hypothetical protein
MMLNLDRTLAIIAEEIAEAEIDRYVLLYHGHIKYSGTQEACLARLRNVRPGLCNRAMPYEGYKVVRLSEL